MPDRKLQTQCASAEDEKAKERIRKRGAEEKARHDKSSREEDLAVGVQVLLRNRRKRKGMPKYDPKPYTIIELVGRQAVIQRGNKQLRRETQKVKRYYPTHQQEDDDRWGMALPQRQVIPPLVTVTTTAASTSDKTTATTEADEWEMTLRPQQGAKGEDNGRREMVLPTEQVTHPSVGQHPTSSEDTNNNNQGSDGREAAPSTEQATPPVAIQHASGTDEDPPTVTMDHWLRRSSRPRQPPARLGVQKD